MELKKLWVRGYKSLRDVAVEFPTKMTFVTGPRSGKTALIEALEALRGAGLGGGAAVGIEIWDGTCRAAYEISNKKTLITSCAAGEAEEVVQRFLDGVVVVGEVDWKAVRSLRPASKEARLQPDAFPR